LGNEITRQHDLKRLYVSQETYLKKILKKFGMTNLKLVLIPPMSHYYKLSDEQSTKVVDEHCYMDNISYANIVSFVMYTMICTCPIVYIVRIFNRFMSNLGCVH